MFLSPSSSIMRVLKSFFPSHPGALHCVMRMSGVFLKWLVIRWAEALDSDIGAVAVTAASMQSCTIIW
jgi:hypothetical protein